MRQRTAWGLLLCAVAGLGQAAEPLPTEVKDPFYGQVLFDYHQQNYFTAITHLRAAQQQGRVPHHVDEAELLLGGLYLSYGMQQSAEQTFNQMLARQIAPELRNRIWLALAGIYYERGYEARVSELLGRIDGPLPAAQEEERLLLETSLLLRQGRYAEVEARLKSQRRDSIERDYARYNLAVAHIRQGRDEQGRALLEPLASLDSKGDQERAALRDKANIALGYSHLRHEEFVRARPFFEWVRLAGPLASQALLGLGWVDSGLGNGQAALSTWLPLIARSASDPPVLEGLLAVPYTLNRLGAHGQALDLYKKALNAYEGELNTLRGIISGMDFVALAQELADSGTAPEAGWLWRAEVKSSSILGPYLYRVMAEPEFQEALRNYRDLFHLQRNLAQWQGDLDAYEAMVETRQVAYEGRLPQIQAALTTLESNGVQQQRDRYAAQLQQINTNGAAQALADGDEQAMLERLRQVEARLRWFEGGVDTSEQRRKLELLKGVLSWRLETEYPARLWRVERALQQLDDSLAANARQRQSLAEAQRRSPNDFKRYRQTIKAARSRMADLQQQAEILAHRYEGRMQSLTVAALRGMEAQIEDYRGQALFAAAQIYDRALHAQGEEP